MSWHALGEERYSVNIIFNSMGIHTQQPPPPPVIVHIRVRGYSTQI